MRAGVTLTSKWHDSLLVKAQNNICTWRHCRTLSVRLVNAGGEKKNQTLVARVFCRLAALKTLIGGWAGFSVPSVRFWLRSIASPPCQSHWSRWSLCWLSDVALSAWSSPEYNWPPLLRRWCPIPKPRDLVRPLSPRQRSRTRHRFLVSPGGAEGEISRWLN